MAELTPDIVGQVVAACTEGAEEASEALGRALDAEIAVAVGESGTIDAEKMPEDWAGPGLVLTFTIGASSATLLLPESSELLPEWYTNPDPTGQSKLSTLALELGMILMPGDTMPDSTNTFSTTDLTESLGRGKLGDGAAVLSLELSAGDKKSVASLIWPLGDASAMAAAPTPEAKATEAESPETEATETEAPEAEAPETEATETKTALEAAVAEESKPEAEPSAPAPVVQAKPTPKPPPEPPKPVPVRLNTLPQYSRSLLRIKVPVVVSLAEKRQSLGQIVELGPGSIIQFEKSCEEMLELSVGGQSVATGEAIKVGDKFGLRVTEMILPEERFSKVTSK
jgi:flagellar motor switch protein FliN/FliY